eukprot:CAMPEP_0118823836 /NCGR_PEP_ID=MMETSP1162-20130426/10174_1 /TAXON_ID=33656 /ORGANISM="Phaeocystis Sp, Strain CCMP2710" /LENGTH=773 /DNA_ID=CAMNT_0006754451 /DNA_START=177 /DNA_END=2498 /DNA_ORIENTATION=-
MKSFLTIILSIPCAAATTGYVGPFTSFAGDKKCTSVPDDSSHVPEGVATNFALDYSCDSLQVPSAWQKPRPEEEDSPPQFDFDLAIVGGGVGGAYLVSRLQEEFVIKRGQPMPKIALFERSDKMGGRLMSGYGAGALNLGVGPMTKELYKHPEPMPEYGGMRINPQLYPLVMNRIAYFSRVLFGEHSCPLPRCNFSNPTEKRNCCPRMLKRMVVGDISYVTRSPNASALMRSSTIETKQNLTKPLLLSDISEGTGSPFDKCLLLAVAADAYYNVTGEYDDSSKVEYDPKVKVHPPPKDGLWVTAIKELCDDCATCGIAGMCDLCAQFGDTAASAVVSCSGYDLALDSTSLSSLVGLTEEVTDVTMSSNLYLLSVGFQRFVMGLLQGPEWTQGADKLVQLFKNKGANVAPQYGKQLQSVSAVGHAGTEINTKDLVDQQIERLLGSSSTAGVQAAGVTLKFADGSSATAKSAYLTMLPYDLAALDDFGDWEKVYDNYLPDKSGAVKIVFGWTNVSESLGARLNMTSCDEGLCQRLILDGPADSWVTRQVWLWDAQTIMVYEIAPYENLTEAVKFPSNRFVKISREEGMGEVVKKCFDEIRNTTGLWDLQDPDWARLKAWPSGTLLPGWNATATSGALDNFVDKITRPLGDGVPVYYGNSETARNGDNHGWVEGALEQAERALVNLTVELKLADPPFKPFVPGEYGPNYPNNYDPTDLSWAYTPSPPSPPPLLVGANTLVAAIVASFVFGVGIHAVFQRFRRSSSPGSTATFVEMT